MRVSASSLRYPRFMNSEKGLGARVDTHAAHRVSTADEERLNRVVDQLLEQAAVQQRLTQADATGQTAALNRMVDAREEGDRDQFLATGAVLDPQFLDWLERSLQSSEVDHSGMLVGSVRLGRLLGRGGMGKVYEGWDERLERPVAVKTLDTQSFAALDRERLRREGQALSQLDHPNICRVIDLVETPEADFLLLELVDGATLSATPVLDGGQISALGLGVARALEAAHAVGVVHRDLKPDNIMLTSTGVPKVLDFGIAARQPTQPFGRTDHGTKAVVSEDAGGRASDRLTSAGSILGTLRYMSPEQSRGEVVGPPSDLYSLGVLLFEPVTGEPLHDRSLSRGELLAAAGRGVEPRDLVARLRGSSAPDLEPLLLKLLSTDPAQRPSARETVAELERVSGLPETRRRRRRNVLWVAVAAFLLVLAAATTWFAAERAANLPLIAPDQQGRVAVLPVENETGDPELDWTGVGLAELMAQGVDAAEGIEVIAPDLVQSAMESIGFGPSAGLEQRQLLAAALGVEAIVESTLRSTRSGPSLDLELTSATGSNSRRRVAASDIARLANQATGTLVRRLRPTARVPDLRDTLSHDPLLIELYARGIEAARRSGPEVSAKYFDVCLAEDQDFVAAKLQRAQIHFKQGDAETSDDMVREVLEFAEGEQPAGLLLEALLQQLRSYVIAQDSERALPLAERIEALALQSDRQEAQAASQRMLSNLFLTSGDFARSVELVEAAHRTYEELGFRYEAARSLVNLGITHSYARRDELATETFQRAAAVARDIQSRPLEMIAKVNLASVALNQRKYAEALPILREAAAYFESTGDQRSAMETKSALAMAVHGVGGIEESRSHYEEALASAIEVGDPETIATTKANFADALISGGYVAEGQPLVDDVLASGLWMTKAPGFRGTVAKYRAAAGARAEAVAILRELIAEVSPGERPAFEAVLASVQEGRYGTDTARED